MYAIPAIATVRARVPAHLAGAMPCCIRSHKRLPPPPPFPPFVVFEFEYLNHQVVIINK
jgi:hypothetical protein